MLGFAISKNFNGTNLYRTYILTYRDEEMSFQVREQTFPTLSVLLYVFP